MSTIPPLSGSSNTTPSTSSLFSRWNAHHVVVLGLTAVAIYVIYQLFFADDKPGVSPTSSSETSPETSPRQLYKWMEGMFQFSADDFPDGTFAFSCSLLGEKPFFTGIGNKFTNGHLCFFVDRLPLNQRFNISIKTDRGEIELPLTAQDKTLYNISKNENGNFEVDEKLLPLREIDYAVTGNLSLLETPQEFTFPKEGVLSWKESSTGNWTFTNRAEQAVVILHCNGIFKNEQQTFTHPFVLQALLVISPELLRKQVLRTWQQTYQQEGSRLEDIRLARIEIRWYLKASK